MVPQEITYTTPVPVPISFLLDLRAAVIKHVALWICWLLGSGAGIGKGGENKWYFSWNLFSCLAV